MSEQVAVQTIATAGIVLVAMLGLAGTLATIFGSRIVKRVKAIQGQVENDHDSNLREDLDGKHDDNQKVLTKIANDVAWCMRRLAEQDQRLSEHIETTTEISRRNHEQPEHPTRRELRERRLPRRVAYVPDGAADS